MPLRKITHHNLTKRSNDGDNPKDRTRDEGDTAESETC